MGSFTGKGRDQGRDQRRGTKGRRLGFLNVDPLEERLLLVAAPWQATTTDLADVKAGPLANAGQDLINVYQAYLKNGGNAEQVASQFGTIKFQGGLVGIDTHWGGTGDFANYVNTLRNLGMQITASSAPYGIVEGYLPIAQLRTVAADPQTLSLAPNYKPRSSFVGIANNQAEQALKADVARQTYRVDGTGVTVGVLSDSVNQAANPGGRPRGLAGSVASGDLPSNINILSDGSPTDSDEGRAMLENIRDIAPGANLAFATAFSGLLGFAQNIMALQTQAGANVIVDDVGYAREPIFQDGVISQAVNAVTARGATYFSAAGNAANSGYLSQFRGVQSTAGSLGNGRFMDFDPGSGVTTQLSITVPAGGANLVMQYAQPYRTQQPPGGTGSVTSDLDFFVLNAAGQVVASSRSNNVGTQEPFEQLLVNAAGTYTVVIQVVSGSDPSHVAFLDFGGSGVVVSPQFGNAGGTFYPTTFGHPTAASAIGVGAVPWWAATPFLGQNPLNSEPFSSFGPALSVFNVDGTRKATPELIQTPVVSGPDAGNTSFFGQVIDTSRANPPTPTNLSQNLPSFFGTSSAAPNVAAVAALMKQLDPTLSPTSIRNGLIASAQPLNGAPAGAWNPQGGFGLVNASNALNAVDQLRVATSTPTNGSVNPVSPSVITFTFNRPVDIRRISASNLVFRSLPPNVAVTVGAPIAVDNPQFPTVVSFPINITTNPPGLPANGVFAYALQGPIVSQDNRPLVTFNGSFTLQDATAPRIVTTSINGRAISIQFSEAVRPETLNAATLQLVRAGGVGNAYGQPSNVSLFNDPRVRITYFPVSNTVVLDYSALDQSQFPTDRYYLIVTAGDNGASVLDAAGNRLDGEFNGIFPSGNGAAGGNFFQDLGVRTLLPPTVSAVVMDPGSDSGIAGDENTNITRPAFQGQVASTFPGSLANLTVLAQFNSLHGGAIDLAPGPNGRGFVGSFDAVVRTDANGRFTILSPSLPAGLTLMRLVVVGDADQPPLAGLSSSFDHSFRIDNTTPLIPTNNGVSLTPGGPALPLAGASLSSLTALSINVIDQSNPPVGALGTPPQVLYPAVNPNSAADLRNYALINLTTGTDQSQFIAGATFSPTDLTFNQNSRPSRADASTPFAGRVDLSFRPGLPAGTYRLVVRGLADAAGNVLDNSSISPLRDFQFTFNLQSQPVYITSLTMLDSLAAANPRVVGGPRSYFEVPAANVLPRAEAPPTAIVVDFSTPLAPNADYSNAIQLIRSSDAAGSPSDGDFGFLGVGGTGSVGSGFTRVVAGTSVRLASPTRLVLELAPGTQLAPDKYRIYMPNTGAAAIRDVFGNLLDGEFLGNQTATGTYETLLPDGQYRGNDLSGDGVPGGAFTTGFVVVPNGNVIFARPDYVEDPLNSSTYSDGSLARPYSVLAPQASTAGGNNANNPANFFNFNPTFDRAGIRRFATSAIFAAQQAAANGPVVLVALPAPLQRDPVTGVVGQRTFVLQAPAGADPIVNDGSTSVPFNTTLVFAPGSTLKLSNASLFVQNQGSALQAIGGANPRDRVVFTSYADDTVSGDNNNDGSSTVPRGGDWGGIVYRNFDNVSNNRNLSFPVDGLLRGPSGQGARSGADDTLSILNFSDVRYAGGAVPATRGIRYDAITLFNSRPTLSNANIIVPTGVSAGAQAGISGDFDSFREDDIARGPLVRRTTVANYSLNGIWVRPNLLSGLTGTAQETDALLYPNNPSSLGGAKNFTFDDPLPSILTSQLLVGERLQVNTGGITSFVNNRVYVQPGMMFKSQGGAGISVVNHNASLNIGSRLTINQFDANPNFNPSTPGFRAQTAGDAGVLFTSIFDNAATTSFTNPSTGQVTIVVPAIDSGNSRGVNQPVPGNVPDASRWGSVGIQSGAVAVINGAEFRYGGGSVNGPEGTLPSQSVLSFIIQQTLLNTPLNSGGGGFFGFGLFNPLARLGTRAIVTNNNFFDNLDAAMQIEPNGLLAGDPTRPLASGNPFFGNNLMLRNAIDGLAVVTSRNYIQSPDRTRNLRPQEVPLNNGGVNLTVNSVWDDASLNYVLRGTVVLAGHYDNFFGFNNTAPVPGATFGPEPPPAITLTIQSLLPGTLLADGSLIPTPGQSVVVRMQNDFIPWDAGNLGTYGSAGASIVTGAAVNGGAGFLVGVDDGVDPPSNTGSPLIDPGAGSQIRILGIGGDESSGQQRVPVILTSLRDNTVGVTVRGIPQFKIYNDDPLFTNNPVGNARFNPNAPAARGDAGYIYIGGNSLTDYNLLDPRDGSLIDNADIRFLTSIQVQGGGIVDLAPTPGQNWLTTKLGQTPATQFNSAMALTISGTNLAGFSDAAVFVHPNDANSLIRTFGVGPNPIPSVFRAGQNNTTATRGQGVVLFMVNSTIANSGTGIRANSETTAPVSLPSPQQLVLLNNTFYNNAIGLHSVAPNTGAGVSINDAVYWLAMDNIFANSTDIAIRSQGQQFGSQGQYNLFWQNRVNAEILGTSTAGFQGINGSVFGNPQFRNPAAGDFSLLPNSAAIDASRSEIGPIPAGDAIYPTVDQVLNATGGIRTNPASLPPPATPGRSNAFGGAGIVNDPRKQATLPGTPGRNFVDQWAAVLPSDPRAVLGPASNPATYAYRPIQGERDFLGLLRQDNSGVANVGFGSRPFFDIGAFEFREFFPPKVVSFSTSSSVVAVLPDGSTRDIYSIGGVAGVNQVPQSISFRFNRQLDPASVNAQSVMLVGSGGDGVFGNGNDFSISLTGKLSYDPRTLTVSIQTAGTTLPTDEYLITLAGNGSNVIRDTSGNALDGENTPGNDPNGSQGPLPTGDNFPGGNFYLKFTVDQRPATLVPGSLRLDPSTDTNRLDGLTANNVPAFSGRISDVFPPANPLQGATVFLDILDIPTGQFVQVGSGTTDINGSFLIRVSSPLPDSPYNVGPDGLLGAGNDDSGYGLARVRVVDQAGNVSNNFNDPLSSFLAAGAAITFVVDTQAPSLTSISPTSGSLVTTGSTTITFTTDKNIDPNSLNANSVRLFSPGGDGVFGTVDDTPIPLTGVTFTVTPLRNGPKGPQQISFSLPAGLGNNLFRLVLTGSGPTPITDIPGNPLNGAGRRGTDFVIDFVVNDPGAIKTYFVGKASDIVDPTQPQGNRDNPFLTIAAAINQAAVGDFVGILPGVYTETINLKSLVRIQSTSPASTDRSFQSGDALRTIIRAPATATGRVTVSANNLFSVPGLYTELSGVTIASPLVGNQANGALDPTSIAVAINNSTLVLSRNYIITAGIGVSVSVSGPTAPPTYLQSNVIVGNIFGVVITDAGAASVPNLIELNNNTIASNQVGVLGNVSASSPVIANLANNIFWQNHDLTPSRNGAAVLSNFPNKLAVRSNLFSGNGPSDTNPGDDTVNVGGGFSPAILGPTPDQFGNFTGDPAFVAPRDPRPGADGPASFFIDTNFSLRSPSAAIDAANPAWAAVFDFLFRKPVDIPGRGFPGTGPADVGAFEFNGVGGIPPGGAFRVASSSLATDGGARADNRALSTQVLNNEVIVNFSDYVDQGSVDPTDLVLSGDGVDSSDPVRAVGLEWIDAHTVRFLLSGRFNSSGTVSVTIPAGAVKSKFNDSLLGFSDSIQIAAASTNPSGPATPTPVAVTPAPAASPTRRGRRNARKNPGGKNNQPRPKNDRPKAQPRPAARPRPRLIGQPFPRPRPNRFR